MSQRFMKKNIIRMLAGVNAALLIVTTVASCGGKKESKYDNETSKLVFSTLELDGDFNPFFSAAQTDSTIVGMTQIGMLGNDKDGNWTYGDDEPTIAQDVEIIYKDKTGNIIPKDNKGNIPKEREEDVKTSTYYFVMKNDVQFSDASYLTIKDVLFNYYIYLDPAYTGSSTIYSTEIVGLKEYRTQSADKEEQDAFNTRFETAATNRIDTLKTTAQSIFDNYGDTLSEEDFLQKLKQEAEANKDNEAYKNIVKDYNKALELFQEELEKDYSNAVNGYNEFVLKDEDGKEYKNLFTTDVEMFLYNEGCITWNKKDAVLESPFVTGNDMSDLKKWTKEQAISQVRSLNVPSKINEVISYWGTAFTLKDFIAKEEMELFYQGADKQFKNISGIKFANMDAPVTVNGKSYEVPNYKDSTKNQVVSGNEVLSIEIEGIDPKAIWNFSIGVAPMKYYSDEAHIEAFNYVDSFGVEYGAQSFMDKVVKIRKVPIGGGVYAASKASGGIANIEDGDFWNNNVVYFERNPYFVLGPAKIKQVRYQVVPASGITTSLFEGSVDFAEPNAKTETIKDLEDRKDKGIGYDTITTSGYGYIGVNAGLVPSIYVRRAIMHAIDITECVKYYGKEATAIYRPMSTESWAYPKGSTAYYPYIGNVIPEDLNSVYGDYADYVTNVLGLAPGDKLTESQQKDYLKYLIEDLGGYTLNGQGIYQNGKDKLKYTFTIAGDTKDHPAFQALWHAKNILDEVGFQINVNYDSAALRKLTTGELAVWAAAWGSTIDPDMYQVYHMDSKATSTLNWGYKQIKNNAGNKYDYELDLVEALSEKIDIARKTNDREKRTAIYKDALNTVMELAVELPTYQRKDLYAYNANKIDESTFTPKGERTSFNGLTSKLWKISFKVS